MHESIRDCFDARVRPARRTAAITRSRSCSSMTNCLTSLLDPAEIRLLLDPTDHIGDAPERARACWRTRVRGARTPFPVPRDTSPERPVNKGLEVARGKTKDSVRETWPTGRAGRSKRSTTLRRVTARVATRSRVRAGSPLKRRRAFSGCSTCAVCPPTIFPAVKTTTITRCLCGAATMVSLEVVVRGVAAGSLVRAQARHRAWFDCSSRGMVEYLHEGRREPRSADRSRTMSCIGRAFVDGARDSGR